MTSLLDSIVVVPGDGFTDTSPGDDYTPNDEPPSTATGPTCEVCGREIPWSGRGRKPKKCDDHKTRTSATAGTSAVRATPAADKRKQARLDAVAGDLQQGLGELAGTIVGIAPVTAGTIALQGPPAAEAIVRIAADHPRFLDGLEQAAKAIPYIAIGKFAAALMLAISVDMGRVQPTGIAAEYLRVAEAAQQVGWTPPPPPGEGTSDIRPARDAVPPPRFEMPWN